jgi:hypothetical protein
MKAEIIGVSSAPILQKKVLHKSLAEYWLNLKFGIIFIVGYIYSLQC